MTDDRLRILVVDDTVVYRKIVRDILDEMPDVEVVGTAHNGKAAMSRIATLKPDLLTLDIEMPEMNGIEVLERIKEVSPGLGAIMLSTLTQRGGDMTMKALELGAFDFISKPQEGSMEENKTLIKNAISPMLKAFKRLKDVRGILGGAAAGTRPVRPSAGTGEVRRVRPVALQPKTKSEIIAIGVSTGGPNALAGMLPMIPGDIGAPILIVQHMPPVFTQSLARSLDAKCAIEVREAKDGESLEPSTAVIAPGGKHMKIVAAADGKTRIIRITSDPPENSCRPSVDYLFRSVAHHYVGRSTGVIMTGMGADGTLGLRLMKRSGSATIAQDEATSVVYGMPMEAFKSGAVDIVAPLDRIASEIVKTVRGRK
ncbi:MAG: chemotaxis response regulator protein-glutamate methylesterase [Thermodesulfobacteriota bacterium]|nr:chemotaxis response regulator protein-glutamate methylesterase [Thermodesulfobacteriota bacterium]